MLFLTVTANAVCSAIIRPIHQRMVTILKSWILISQMVVLNIPTSCSIVRVSRLISAFVNYENCLGMELLLDFKHH